MNLRSDARGQARGARARGNKRICIVESEEAFMCGRTFRRFHRRHSNTNDNRWAAAAAATRRRHFIEFLEQRRLLSGGVPDPSFGSGGKVVTDFPGTAFDAAGGSAIQSDGRIVVLSAGNDADSARLVRYTANGQLDATF